jgi:hypothetical protein
MAYDQNGALMIDRGLGWVPAAPAPALGDDGGCGCGRNTAEPAQAGLGAAETGSAWMPIGLALVGIWVVSAMLAGK